MKSNSFCLFLFSSSHFHPHTIACTQIFNTYLHALFEPVTDCPMWRDARLDYPTSCHLEMDDDKRRGARERQTERNKEERRNADENNDESYSRQIQKRLDSRGTLCCFFYDTERVLTEEQTNSAYQCTKHITALTQVSIPHVFTPLSLFPAFHLVYICISSSL